MAGFQSELALSTFRSALRSKDFVITAEPVLRPDTTAAELRQVVRCLRDSVDAVQIGNDRYADGPIASLAAASIILNAGADVVLRMSSRDRNKLALQGDLIGAAALGVRNVLLERGRKLPDSLRGKVKSVFDTTSNKLLAMAKLVAETVDDLAESGFTLGSSATIVEPDKNWQGSRLIEKIDAGATFLLSQPCLNSGLVAKYMAGVVSLKLTHRASILVEVPLLDSGLAANALKLADAGAPLPRQLVKRIADASDPVAEGESVCAEVVSEVAKIAGVSGINILFSGDVGRVLSVLGKCEWPDGQAMDRVSNIHGKID